MGGTSDAETAPQESQMNRDLNLSEGEPARSDKKDT